MPSLTLVNHAAAADSDQHSRITDLTINNVAGVDHLFSSTRFDGLVQQWTIDGGDLTLGDGQGFAGPDLAGSVSGIATLSFNGDTQLLTGGGSGGALQLLDVNAGGDLGTVTALTSLAAQFEGFQHASTLTLADGSQVAFGAMAGATGLASLRFDTNGTLQGSTISYDAGTSQIAATAVATVGAASFILSISAGQNTLTSRAVHDAGAVGTATTIGADDSLWISAPTALETAQVGAATYAVLAAAGSNSLTVIEITDDGSMIVRDHILDARDTRYGGATALDIIQADGKTYVIAGGADDGISVFVLLEGGLLVHRDQIEDTVDVSLDNISDIVARDRGDGLDIYVASSSEPGITQLRFDTDLPGVVRTAALGGGLLSGSAGADVLQGHNGNDIINASNGDDILRDGAGSDTLTGGSGADLFILSADGVTDTITDFTPGEDSIDLSLWPMLRDISQLYISLRPDGMLITYGDEQLIVQSADGNPIDYRDLSTADLIGASRLPTSITPGYPGPATPPPDTGAGPSEPPIDQGGPNSMLTTLQLIADANLDALRDSLGRAPLQPAPDSMVINGTDQADTLAGADGFDLILAGNGDDTARGLAGSDTLFGNAGHDILDGGDGADTLFGGSGNDTLTGGNGHDYLNGGAGDDVLWGRTGADTFEFNGGTDVIGDFEQGIDHLTLDTALWTGLTSAADVLLYYGSFADGRITIDLGDGNILHIDGITDVTTLAEDISLF
ncbi:calcium-binding protein [Loktanella sp. Alg231-35]|uniref:calcium-binding protein n=1 Tax=Loktanella sp. Alg231-35 TaxID=1922220 RepID=UPI000D550D5C|nr:calcium-binding protein [Loktanella sp. Alg231-35]